MKVSEILEAGKPSHVVSQAKVLQMIYKLALECLEGASPGLKSTIRYESTASDSFFVYEIDDVTDEIQYKLNHPSDISYGAPIQAVETAVQAVVEKIIDHYKNPHNFGPGEWKKYSLKFNRKPLTDQRIIADIKKLTGVDISK